MSEATNHPDFEAAAIAHRWSRSLNELRTELRAGAFRARGKPVWYVLPHGASISMRVDVDAFPHRELRIARSVAPANESGRAAWAREVTVFRRYLDAEGWTVRHEGVTATGGIEIVLSEVLAIGKQIGPLCIRCGALATGGPYKDPLCIACAIKAGNEEMAQRGHVR